MPKCKNCGSERCVRNGRVRGKQRHRCAECRFNYVEGDARTNDGIAAKRAMPVLLHSLGKASFNMLAHIFDMWPSQVHRWVAREGLSAPEPEVHGEVREIEFDEMWHFVESKKTGFGSSRRLTAAHGEPWPGCSAIVMLRPSGGSTKK